MAYKPGLNPQALLRRQDKANLQTHRQPFLLGWVEGFQPGHPRESELLVSQVQSPVNWWHRAQTRSTH